MAESTSNTKREWSRAVGAIAVIVLMMMMFVGFVMLFGAVRGEEFSPTTFARRSFVFYRIPLLKLQVTPVVRASTTNALETHLATKLFADLDSSAQTTALDNNPNDGEAAKQRWDIVRITPLSRPSEIGSAFCLCAYLDRQQAGKLKWLSWTKTHPKLARALWLVVRQVAIDRLYFSIPDLMTAAEQAVERGTSPSALHDELAQIAEAAASLREQADTSGKKP